MSKRALVRFKQSMENSAFINDMRDKLESGKDIQIVIVGRNAETGTGKTVLAIALSKVLDEHGWDHTKGTLDFERYQELYDTLPPRSAILLDEMELIADSRRALSKENVDLSQMWSMFRYRQMVTIGTIPSADQLDKRMKKLSNGRLTVIERGKAFPYWYRVDDFSGKVDPRRYKKRVWTDSGRLVKFPETITFPDLSDTEDYKEMHKKKEEATQKWMKARRNK